MAGGATFTGTFLLLRFLKARLIMSPGRSSLVVVTFQVLHLQKKKTLRHKKRRIAIVK